LPKKENNPFALGYSTKASVSVKIFLSEMGFDDWILLPLTNSKLALFICHTYRGSIYKHGCPAKN